MSAPLPFGNVEAAVRELVRRSYERVRYSSGNCEYCVGGLVQAMPRTNLCMFQHDEDCPWWALTEWVRANPDELSSPPRARELAWQTQGIIDHDRSCVECQVAHFCDEGLRKRAYIVDTLGGIL